MPSPNVDDAGRFMNAAQFQAEYSFMGADHDKSNVFSDWLYPQDKEMRQLGQQAMLTQIEPQLRMEGMKAAGINPLTAAAGIAGSGSGSIPQPAASTNPIGDIAGALSSVGDVTGAVTDIPLKRTQGKANLAAADADEATARNADRIADSEVFLNASNAAKALNDAGIPEISSMELGLGLAKNGLKGFANAFNADHLCREYSLEMDKLDAEISVENERFENLQKLSGLYMSETDWTNEKANHERILNDIDGKKRDLLNKYQTLPEWNEFSAQFILAQEYGYNSPQYNAYMSFLKDKFYNQGLGSYNADMDTAFARAANQVKGQFEVEAEYKPYLDGLDIIKSAYEEFFKAMADSPTNIKGIFAKFAGNVMNAAQLIGISRGDDTNRGKPHKGHPYHSTQHPAY